MVGTIDFKSKNFLMRKILRRVECRAYLLKEIEVNYYENLLSFLGIKEKREFLMSRDIGKLGLLFPKTDLITTEDELSLYRRILKGRGRNKPYPLFQKAKSKKQKTKDS